MQNLANNSYQVISPARINLIGEHIDYNGGSVLPAAIDLNIKIKIYKRNSNLWKVTSDSQSKDFIRKLNDYSLSSILWHNYIIGVIFEINQIKPNIISGFIAKIKSEIPIGIGISSSAALTCGLASGLNKLFNLRLTKFQIINISRNAEHKFTGVKCGFLDQYAVLKSKKNNFLHLNCSNLKLSYVPVNLKDYEFLLLNSNVKHSLAESEYNNRVLETQNGFNIIRKFYPQTPYLCSVSLSEIESIESEFSKKIYKRMLFSVNENNRVNEAVSALKVNDLAKVGKLMYESHKDLNELFEVSCDEINYLVGLCKKSGLVLGSRMIGGGFGGCTLNLIKKVHKEKFIKFISKNYYQKYHLKLEAFAVSISKSLTVRKL